MPRGLSGTTCAHPREEKRVYVHPRTGRTELRCRICHRLNCRQLREKKRITRKGKGKTSTYYKHYDVRVYVELSRAFRPLPTGAKHGDEK